MGPEAHALAADDQEIDQHCQPHQQREGPAGPAAQIEATDEKRCPGRIRYRPEMGDGGGQVHARDRHQRGEQDQDEGALGVGIHAGRLPGDKVPF